MVGEELRDRTVGDAATFRKQQLLGNPILNPWRWDAEQFAEPCIHMREVGLQLLDALERLESLDRRFQIRSRIAAGGDRDAADDRG